MLKTELWFAQVEGGLSKDVFIKFLPRFREKGVVTARDADRSGRILHSTKDSH